jgi:pimeloyl-ACP methyl ester carboxylesterase
MFLLLLLLLPLAAAGVFLLRLFLRQDQLIFRPGPVLDRSPATIGIHHEEVLLTAGDGTTVTAWWVAGAAEAPAVVYFHGSDGNLTHELPVVQFLNSLGVNTLLAEYVGYGSDRRRPNEAGCYRTADAAWEHVTRHRGFAEHRVILFGHSLGASVAARTAAERRCAGLVLQSGFTSLRDLAARAYPYLPVTPFLRSRMDVLDPLRRSRCAVLVIHSLDDEHIPYQQAVRLYEEARTTKKLITVRGSHFGQTWHRSFEVRAAWRELLARDFRTWAIHSEGS